MTKTIMIVGLKVPDTTAKTALQAFKSQGYDNLKELRRWGYYEFDHEGDAKVFGKVISKVDILVNANKNNFIILKSIKELPQSVSDKLSYVLVKDMGDKCTSVLTTIKERLGIEGITTMSKGVLWGLDLQGDKVKLAKELAQNLLYNPHFQEYEVIM